MRKVVRAECPSCGSKYFDLHGSCISCGWQPEKQSMVENYLKMKDQSNDNGNEKE